ncbi:MAG: SapC family protein [Phreatobacter sp.]|uniref:SapC family protein n=1 Tax=Phreatobacter sp. TaxID=1966341 RepID=UPI004035F502
MSGLPLFYRSVEPLNSADHRKFRMTALSQPLAFAATSHLIPAVVDEFPAAAREMAIVFVPAGRQFAPVFLCGMKAGENLFIDEAGRWTGTYVPAYLRRYPFMLGERQDADPVICIDGRYEGFGETEDGIRLFDDEGAPSEALQPIIKLVTDYALAARRTEALSERLAALDLFKSISVDVSRGDGSQSASIHGLSIVDEEKLNALPDEAWLDLRRSGALGVIHAHLFSIGATQALAGRLTRGAPQPADQAA